MVHVSFGGDGATKPLPLISGHVTQNIGTQELRLVHDTMPQLHDKSQKVWIYQYRNKPDHEWNSYYALPETEFTLADLDVLNHYASQNMAVFQAYTVLVVKFLRRGDEIYGKVMLVNGDVKQNFGGKTSLIKICRTEDERVEVLRDIFGITLTRERKAGIKGWGTELKGN